MNTVYFVFSSFVSAFLLCLFLAYVAIPVIIFGSLHILYKEWKKRFFPYGLRDASMPCKKKQESNVIDVEFHEVD